MKTTKEQKVFLETVEEYNDSFNAVKIDGQVEQLNHSFWNSREIADAESLKLEWNVSQDLVPFYGDWHTLFCLNAVTGAVIYLNDERKILFSWHDIPAFVSSLLNREEEPLSESSLDDVKIWLDPDL